MLRASGADRHNGRPAEKAEAVRTSFVAAQRAALVVGTLLAYQAPARGQTAERVFASVSASVVVVEAGALQGSGVVVAARTVATNCHTVGNSEQIAVRRGRVSHAATRLRGDVEKDVCLLTVPTLDAPATTLGQAASLRVGAPVYAVGAPAGLELSLSAGLVSQLRLADTAPLVQTTAAISPGSSGGGLFDERGRLVGLTTFSAESGQALNFALPTEWLTAILSEDGRWLRCQTTPERRCATEEAWASARGTNDPASRAEALSVLATTLARLGDHAAAVQVLAQARAAANAVPDTFDRRVFILANISAQSFAAGLREEAARFLTEALQTASQTGSLEARLSRIENISASVTGGAPTWVERFANSPRPQRAGDRLHAADARNSWAASAVREAIRGTLNSAIAIDDLNRRLSAISFVAEAQARLGDVSAALGMAREIREASAYASAIARIAGVPSAKNEVIAVRAALAEATVMVRREPETSFRAAPLAELAGALANVGDREAARRLLAEARAAARAAGFDRAVASQGGPRASYLALMRDDWLRNLALAQGAMGEGTAALATAGSLSDRFLRESAMRDLARLLLDTGDVPAALAATRSLPPQDRDYLLWDIVDLQLSRREFAGARAVADEIADSSSLMRNDALSRIVEAHLNAGDMSGAMALARGRRDPEARDRAGLIIVEGQVNAGDLPGAVATARSMRDAGTRNAANVFIARGQAQARDTSAALATIGALPFELRAVALVGVLAYLPTR